MNGALHIAPVLHLPDAEIPATDIALTVQASHRVLAPHRPVVRKAQSFDEFAIAGLRDSVFGWTVDLSFLTTSGPLAFQFNWTLIQDGQERKCQHDLTVTLMAAGAVKEPLWSLDVSLWDEVAVGRGVGGDRTPFSVFSQSQLMDDMQRDLSMTVRPKVTTITETLSVPAMERGDIAVMMGHRYAAAESAAA